MKLNTQAFPYPVLNNTEGAGADYKDSAFQVAFEFDQAVDEENNFGIRYSFMLSNEEILDHVENDNASYAIVIVCTQTMKRESHFLEKEGFLTLDATELYGNVEFIPMVVVKKPIIAFMSQDLNDEFEGTNFDLKIGDILAIDDTHTKNIEFDYLSFENLVKVRNDDNLGEFDYRIDMDPSFMYISLGKKMREVYQEIVATKKLNPVVYMSLYKDVVFSAIEELIENEEAEDYKWARSLSTKIQNEGMEIPEESDFNKINLIAQRLLQVNGVQKYFSETSGLI